MNCPSRTEELPAHDGMNQNPSGLSADLTTRQDFNGMVNTKTKQDCSTLPDEQNTESPGHQAEPVSENTAEGPSSVAAVGSSGAAVPTEKNGGACVHMRPLSTAVSVDHPLSTLPPPSSPSLPLRNHGHTRGQQCRHFALNCCKTLRKFGRFIGPGFIIAVAYIDPGNYSTDVAAGAATQFKLLFIVLMSNIFAITLQSLAVRLGTVTGMNLAEHCRAHLPRWLNWGLYLMAEGAIICTDVAEVIGGAIALNLLIKVPLVVGCLLTLVDVLIILLFYQPKGDMKRVRAFEYFVVALVLGVVVCFCIQLSFLRNTSAGQVFKGFLPSAAVVQGQGIYLSCGILGATVMPHSLYLGSGMVQSRLRDYDIRHGYTTAATIAAAEGNTTKVAYRPSLAAIKSCMTTSIVEMAVALFTFALFVNSAILIMAGGALSSTPGAADADLFAIHNLLSSTIAPIAGTIFALALLLSGTSAGIVCTIAGQMISEGALHWTIAPWLRRLLTRSVSITPSIIIAGAVGRDGLSAALNATQVALSVCLPFLAAPLIYFTCRGKYMVTGGPRGDAAASRQHGHRYTSGGARVGEEGSSVSSSRASSVELSPYDTTAGPRCASTSRASATVVDGAVDVARAGAGAESHSSIRTSTSGREEDGSLSEGEGVRMRNHWILSLFGVVVWLVITVMNVALLVLVGLGVG